MELRVDSLTIPTTCNMTTTLSHSLLSHNIPYSGKCLYRIVLCKCPSPSKGPPPNFDSSVVCEVLHVTTHHVRLVHDDLKVHSHVDCFDEFQAPLHVNFFYINFHQAFGKKFCILLSHAHEVCHFVKQKFIVLLSAEASSESKCMKYLSVKSCHMSVNGWQWSQSFCCGCDQREAVMGHILNISFVGTSKRLDHLEGHPRAVHISLTPIFHSQSHHAMHKNHWLETIGSLFAQKIVSSTNKHFLLCTYWSKHVSFQIVPFSLPISPSFSINFRVFP